MARPAPRTTDIMAFVDTMRLFCCMLMVKFIFIKWRIVMISDTIVNEIFINSLKGLSYDMIRRAEGISSMMHEQSSLQATAALPSFWPTKPKPAIIIIEVTCRRA